MKIYMINKGELQVIGKPIFSTGDSYLIDDEKIIYIWLGKVCSVDEKTVAAAKARELDEGRGGAAKIITLDEDQETKEFLKLVGGMRVVEKNIAKTMLVDVKTGDWSGAGEHVKALYRVSSEEFEDINTMKFVQVPFKKESLDSEDCFIADLGDAIYVWQGKTCSVKERVKSGQWARNFDADRAGSQNEEIFEEGDDAKFIDALEGKITASSVDEHVQLSAESSLETKAPEPEPAKAPEPEPAKAPEPEPAKAPEPEPEPAKKEEPPAEATTQATGPVKKPAGEAQYGVSSDILEIEKPSGRRKCPKCSEERKNMIHEYTDRDVIIMDYPRVFGKRYQCGSCGIWWREK